MRLLFDLVLLTVITLGLCSRWRDPALFAHDMHVTGKAVELLGEVIQEGGHCLQRLSAFNESADMEV